MFTIGSDKYPGLAKLIEECSELQTILAKLITTGGESAYWSGRELDKDLIEELGDVRCALTFFIETALTDEQADAVGQRAAFKLDRYRLWHGQGSDRRLQG